MRTSWTVKRIPSSPHCRPPPFGTLMGSNTRDLQYYGLLEGQKCISGSVYPMIIYFLQQLQETHHQIFLCISSPWFTVKTCRNPQFESTLCAKALFKIEMSKSTETKPKPPIIRHKNSLYHCKLRAPRHTHTHTHTHTHNRFYNPICCYDDLNTHLIVPLMVHSGQPAVTRVFTTFYP